MTYPDLTRFMNQPTQLCLDGLNIHRPTLSSKIKPACKKSQNFIFEVKD